MNSIDETMYSFCGIEAFRKLKSTFRAISNIYNFYQRYFKSSSSATFKSANKDVSSVNNNNLRFTGQQTDLAFLTSEQGVSFDYIKKIKDNDLKTNVMKVFIDAERDGYVEIVGDKISLTEKGREYVNSDAFIRQFEKDQIYTCERIINQSSEFGLAKITLFGTPQDLDAFYYADSVDLSTLNVPNELSTKINDFFNRCQQSDIVTISNNVVKPTEKCKRYLKSKENLSTNFAIEKISAENMKAVAETAQVATKTTGVGIVIELSKEGLKLINNAINTTQPKQQKFN